LNLKLRISFECQAFENEKQRQVDSSILILSFLSVHKKEKTTYRLGLVATSVPLYGKIQRVGVLIVSEREG
jgi:hypothetical protein